MKNRKYLFLMLGLLIVIVLAGCKDDNQKCNTKAVSGKETKILGSWKQVNAETVFHENQTFDYSCNNIIYKFVDDSTLLVESDIDDYIGIAEGEFKYKYQVGESEIGLYRLIVNGTDWSCMVYEKKMTLSNAYVDGPALFFIRIK